MAFIKAIGPFASCNFRSTRDQAKMIACLESPLLVNISKRISRVASVVLEASASNKDGEFLRKFHFLCFQHSHATEAAHQAYLFAAMYSPCARLACFRLASPTLSLPCGWKFTTKVAQNGEVSILAGEPNEQQHCTR